MTSEKTEVNFMAVVREPAEPRKPRRPPATTPEAQENRMINLAVNLAEKQLREGTASAQVTVHYLKLGTTREQLEQDKLASENALLRARVQQLSSAGEMKSLIQDALTAMRTYTGQEVEEDYED